MKISFENTKSFIELVLHSDEKSARTNLHLRLVEMGFNEGQFYQGIIDHAPGMRLTSDQWFQLLCRLPNRILRTDIDLKKYLSQNQIDQLPPEAG